MKNISTLRQMGSKKSNVHVFRQGSWQEMSSDKLLPGDIFELTKTNEDVTVPCDSLLLNGAAVMNEATLTGPPLVRCFSFPLLQLFLNLRSFVLNCRREHATDEGGGLCGFGQ